MGVVIPFPNAIEKRLESLFDRYAHLQRAFDQSPSRELALDVDDAYSRWLYAAYPKEEAEKAAREFRIGLWGRVA